MAKCKCGRTIHKRHFCQIGEILGYKTREGIPFDPLTGEIGDGITSFAPIPTEADYDHYDEPPASDIAWTNTEPESLAGDLRIEGSAYFVERINEALVLAHQKLSPDLLQCVNAASIILENPTHPSACADIHARIAEIGPNALGQSVGCRVGSIVHEGCHILNFIRGVPLGRDDETLCLKAHIQALRQIGGESARIRELTQALNNPLAHYTPETLCHIAPENR